MAKFIFKYLFLLFIFIHLIFTIIGFIVAFTVFFLWDFSLPKWTDYSTYGKREKIELYDRSEYIVKEIGHNNPFQTLKYYIGKCEYLWN